MKISNSRKRFEIGCVQESNLKIPPLRQLKCRRISGKRTIRQKRSDSEGRNSTIRSR